MSKDTFRTNQCLFKIMSDNNALNQKIIARWLICHPSYIIKPMDQDIISKEPPFMFWKQSL